MEILQIAQTTFYFSASLAIIMFIVFMTAIAYAVFKIINNLYKAINSVELAAIGFREKVNKVFDNLSLASFINFVISKVKNKNS